MLEKIVSLPRKAVNLYSDVKSELKKVTWPGKKEIYGTTIVVLAAVFFFGFYLFVVDTVLQIGIRQVLNYFT